MIRLNLIFFRVIRVFPTQELLVLLLLVLLIRLFFILIWELIVLFVIILFDHFFEPKTARHRQCDNQGDYIGGI